MHNSFYLALPLILSGAFANAQGSNENADVMFILDGSGSMWGAGERYRENRRRQGRDE